MEDNRRLVDKREGGKKAYSCASDTLCLTYAENLSLPGGLFTIKLCESFTDIVGYR